MRCTIRPTRICLFVLLSYLNFLGCVSHKPTNVVSAHVEVKTYNISLIDTARIKCTYQFTFLTDSVKMTYRDKDLYVIQIGDIFTKSYCYQTFYVDSMLSTPKGNNEWGARLDVAAKAYLSNMPNNLKDLNRGFFQFYVYKDYKKEKITVTDNISGNFFIYEEELKPQDWTVLEDTINILGYICQKAVCDYRGRSYEAWFTSEIPISEGPYKFYGLPGLIVKLEDTESHYSFEMKGLQQVNDPMYMTVQKYSRKINRLSFLKLKMKRTGTDLVAMDLAKTGISSVGSGELHYDYIERDYK